MLKDNISFAPMSLADLPLIHTWFNQPHVQQFYSLRNWSEQEVFEKLNPVISGEKPVTAFIIHYNGLPIGYIQYYRVIDFPWPNQDFSEMIIQKSAGLDLFIGEADYLERGLGVKIIQQFLEEKIWPEFNYCIVDPDINNVKAIHCYEKLGFKTHKIIKDTDPLNRAVDLRLMIHSKIKTE